MKLHLSEHRFFLFERVFLGWSCGKFLYVHCCKDIVYQSKEAQIFRLFCEPVQHGVFKNPLEPHAVILSMLSMLHRNIVE